MRRMTPAKRKPSLNVYAISPACPVISRETVAAIDDCW
jgi:hypothetical protein